jgi:hypothetical protein
MRSIPFTFHIIKYLISWSEQLLWSVLAESPSSSVNDDLFIFVSVSDLKPDVGIEINILKCALVFSHLISMCYKFIFLQEVLKAPKCQPFPHSGLFVFAVFQRRLHGDIVKGRATLLSSLHGEELCRPR